MAVKIQVEVFWVVAQYNVVGYHHFLVLCCLLSPWRWRQQDPPNCWYPILRLYCVTTQKTSTFFLSVILFPTPVKRYHIWSTGQPSLWFVFYVIRTVLCVAVLGNCLHEKRVCVHVLPGQVPGSRRNSWSLQKSR